MCDNDTFDPYDQPVPFQRKGSVFSRIYRSLRVSKKVTRSSVRRSKLVEVEQETTSVFLVKQVSVENLVVHTEEQYTETGFLVFGKPVYLPQPCNLLRSFPNTGLPYDRQWGLTSFKRKLRSHAHVQEALAPDSIYCPVPASQVQLSFRSQMPMEVFLRVIAPNGASATLRPTKSQWVDYCPNKPGCGHGSWTIEVAIRTGIKLRAVKTHKIELYGYGTLYFDVEDRGEIRLVNKEWLPPTR